MLFAARGGEGAFAAPGLPERRPATLDEAAARALLAESVRRRVLGEARGDPPALLELPAGLRVTAEAAGAAAPARSRGTGRARRVRPGLRW